MPAGYRIGIDWDGDGDYTGTGEDVTGRVLERSTVTIRYGRDQSRALAPAAPGEARLELDNRSRDYSPENAASPLAGLILPARPVRVEASLGASTYNLFTGRYDGYDVLPARERRSVQITCLDAIGRLRGTQITTPLHRGIRTGTAVGLILVAAGWPEDDMDLDAGATVMPWWWAAGDDAYAALQQVVDSEGPGALLTVNSFGLITFYDRHHRIRLSASTVVQATWSDTSGSEPAYSDLVYDHGWRDLINHVAVDVPQRQLDGELTEVWSSTATISLADGETTTLIASLSTPALGVIAPTSDAGDITLATGAATATISATSGAVITVSLRAVGGPAVITGVQLRGYALRTVSTVRVEVEDSTSIATYGRRSLPGERQPTWAGVHDARAIGDITLAQRAQRLPVVMVTMTGGDDARLEEQLGRDLSDRVHITNSETGLDADFLVEQIEHEISQAGRKHVTRFGCEMVPVPVTNPFMFDVTGAGFDDGNFGAIGIDDGTSVFIFDDPTQGKFDFGQFGN